MENAYRSQHDKDADDVVARIKAHEDRLAALLGDLFGKETK